MAFQQSSVFRSGLPYSSLLYSSNAPLTSCMSGKGGYSSEAGSLLLNGGDFSDTDSEHSARREEVQGTGPIPTESKLSRKRRRGIIEKRRRDRINASLSELRRLVPAAFERQGSQKLEKAEILQLSVQYLAQLQSRGLESVLSGDEKRLATDYHSMGFRECASEVARYLTAAEGLHLQDPLCMRLAWFPDDNWLNLRLLSHLQCYNAQSHPVQAPPNNSATSIFPPATSTTESEKVAISPQLPHFDSL